MADEPQFPRDDDITPPQGSNRINEAREHVEEVKRRAADGGRAIVTSRDPDMNEYLFKLRRGGSHGDYEQWQLPVEFTSQGRVYFFLTVVQPGGVVQQHKHDRDLFRVVVSGSIILKDGRELKAGDWMFVPGGVEYSFRGSLNPGAIIYHCYG